MPFKVSDATWLDTETERVTGVILLPKFWRRAWTPQSLQEALRDIGLEYSMPEIQLINDELHHLGVVVDVGP